MSLGSFGALWSSSGGQYASNKHSRWTSCARLPVPLESICLHKYHTCAHCPTQFARHVRHIISIIYHYVCRANIFYSSTSTKFPRHVWDCKSIVYPIVSIGYRLPLSTASLGSYHPCRRTFDWKTSLTASTPRAVLHRWFTRLWCLQGWIIYHLV